MTAWLVLCCITQLASLSMAGVGDAGDRVPVSSRRDLPGDSADILLGQPGGQYPLPNRTDGRGLVRPAAVALDTSTTPPRMFVADMANHRVLGYRTVIQLGQSAHADLVIGQPDLHSGLFNDEEASRERLVAPIALAVDAQGNLYVADPRYNRVTRYDRPFDTDTVADGVFGQADWQGMDANPDGVTARSLASPSGLCCDSAGHLWVADAGNNRVLCYRQPLTSSRADVVLGQPDFISGGQSKVSGTTFYAPTGLAWFGKDLLVADAGNNRVLRFADPLANPSQPAVASFGQDGSLTSNKAGCSPFNFNRPTEVAVAAGSAGPDLYVCDSGNNRVLRFALNASTGAQPTGLWGQPNLRSALADPELAGPATLLGPSAIAVAPDQTLWIADRENHRVLGYSAGSSQADRVIGQINFRHNFANLVDGRGLSFPRDVAIDKSVHPNRLYVCDFDNNRVLGYASVAALHQNSEPDLIIGQRDAYRAYRGCGPAGLREPSAIAVDSTGGLYVADRENNRVLWYDRPFETDTLADRVFGQPDMYGFAANSGGISPTSLNRPEGVAIDSTGNLYISDTRNHRILRYNRVNGDDTVADMVWGQKGKFDRGIENAGGQCGADTLYYPFKLTIHPDGKLLVADTGNHRVLMFDTRSDRPELAVRVWGQAGDFTSHQDNRGGCSASSLSGPEAVGLIGEQLWIADTANCRLLHYDNILSQQEGYDRADAVWGQFGSFSGRQLGMGITSSRNLWFPSGLDFDSDGNLYVADREQSRVAIYKVKR